MSTEAIVRFCFILGTFMGGYYSVSKNNMAGTEISYRDTQKSKMEIGRA